MASAPEQIELVTNIIEEYNGASPADVEDGKAWYVKAHSQVRQLAEKYQITVNQAALVVAALSPQLAWPLNIKYADEFLERGECGHFLSCQVKAMECLSGSRQVLSENGKNALKTHNFAQLLENPYADLVCVDGHAASVALGRKVNKADSDRLTRNAKNFYNVVEGAYREAADMLGLEPSTLQAITWLVYRARTGIESLYGR